MRRIITADKRKIKYGRWQTGVLPRSRFAYGQKRRQRFGAQYKWNVISFECTDRRFKILLLLNLDKSIFRAILHDVRPTGDIFLCEYAYDAKEPGWHCHANCPQGGARASKSRRAPWIRRLPKHGNIHRRISFVRNEREAIERVRVFFRLTEGGDLL